jgi:hypothetical protein
MTENARESEFGGIMKRFWLVGLALATALAATPVAMADSYGIYFLSTSGSPNPTISGSGIITTTLSGSNIIITGGTVGINGSFTSSTLSGTVISTLSPPGTLTYADFDISPVSYSTTKPTDADWDSFDNILAPGVSPYVDHNGIYISLSNGEDLIIYSYTDSNKVTGDYWNLYTGTAKTSGNPSGNPDNGSWLITGTGNDGSGGDPIDLSISPEPSSFLLFGTGLLGLAAFVYCGRQTVQHRAV